MKKKILIFIGIITLIMSFMLAVPKTKAQENTDNWIVVKSYDLVNGDVTFYTYDTNDFFGTYDYDNIFDKYEILPFITKKENIPIVFRLNDVFEIIDSDIGYIIIDFVKPAGNGLQFFTINDMVDFQVYEYKGIYDNMYVFQQGLNFYKVEMDEVTFRNYIEGEIDFETILKPGNLYVYMKTLGPNQFWFNNSYDYQYYLGISRGQEQGENTARDAYLDGYNAGSKLAEGLLESEYQRGYQNGTTKGLQDGYNQGYQNGFNNAYSEIITTDEYTLGYNNGFKDGEKSKLAKNNETFYNGIGKWLVPAVITVIVLGGIFSIASFKRREQ
jgi:hypothetical protein